jgi:hypothetical protein
MKTIKFKEIKSFEVGGDNIVRVILGITENGEVYRFCFNDGRELTWVKTEIYNK